MKGKRMARQAVDPPDGEAGKKRKVRRRVIVLLLVVLVLVTALAVAARVFIQEPQLTDPADTNLQEEGPIRISGDRKADFYTFLVIGRDTGGGGNTDTILLASYDVAGQVMNVMSIPRDTMVNVAWDVKKINSVYNFGGGGDEGIDALGREIAQLVGFVPDFQVVVEWKAVGELVEALGGVYYDVPRDMYYVDPTQDLYIDVKAGYQKLDGLQAMQVVRFRDGPNGYANGDLGRIETQQGFLKALIGECLKISNVTRIGELAQVFQDNVTTNLTVGNMGWFAQKAIFGGLTVEHVNFYTMPCTGSMVWSRSYHQRISYVVPKTQELVELVNAAFNPFKEDLLESELDIMYVASDGTIGSSTGKVEDTRANTAVQSAGSQAQPVEVDPYDLPQMPQEEPGEEPELPEETGEGEVPTEPVEPVEPTEPIEPTEPAEPVQPEDPTQGGETEGTTPVEGTGEPAVTTPETTPVASAEGGGTVAEAASP